MNNLINIEKTSYSPQVSFSSSGVITFSGELRAENPEAFFMKVNEKIDTHLTLSKTLKINDLKLIFRFEYIGSSNALALFKFIRDAHDKKIDLIWEYDSIDEDLAELGDIIKTGYASSIELKEMR